jgi:peptidyl-tRNA hydrolase, PTH1 family
MFLLAGLGNPTVQYEDTRHNAGAIAVEAIVKTHALQFIGTKFHADAWKGRVGMHEIVAIIPNTFMNRSGIAVGEAARFYRIPPEAVYVLYDDLDLAPCKFRIKQGGGNGGHNGLRDIDRVMPTDYWRLRLGIGRPLHKEQVTSYVLGKFDAEERAAMERLSDAVASQLPLLLDGKSEKMMTAVALAMQGT